MSTTMTKSKFKRTVIRSLENGDIEKVISLIRERPDYATKIYGFIPERFSKLYRDLMVEARKK